MWKPAGRKALRMGVAATTAPPIRRRDGPAPAWPRPNAPPPPSEERPPSSVPVLGRRERRETAYADTRWHLRQRGERGVNRAFRETEPAPSIVAQIEAGWFGRRRRPRPVATGGA